jgi:hypothetical protein
MACGVFPAAGVVLVPGGFWWHVSNDRHAAQETAAVQGAPAVDAPSGYADVDPAITAWTHSNVFEDLATIGRVSILSEVSRIRFSRLQSHTLYAFDAGRSAAAVGENRNESRRGGALLPKSGLAR